MAKIFYSMAGEGRGHATRAWTLAEALRKKHHVTLFAPHDAYDMLAPRYAGNGSGACVRRIDGLRFFYNGQQSIDVMQTVGGFFQYVGQAQPLIAALVEEIRRERPDLIITDFEPALPRAAAQCNVPFISLDHQHVLSVSDFAGLPPRLRLHAAYMGFVVSSFYAGQASTVVSSFYFPPLRSDFRHVRQIGVMLRDEIVRAAPTREGFALVYMRKFAHPRLLEALRDSRAHCRVYGLDRAPDGNLTFLAPNHRAFQQDLITCDALITTAGNQLVGEALYLGKPVLALPEPGNYEQYINAHYLRESGAGDWAEMEEINGAKIQRFIAQLDEYRAHINPERLNGNAAALDEIEQFLPRTAQ